MTTEMTTGTDASSRITDLGLGFASSKILLTALELGVFTVLADGPLTEPELRERFAAAARRMRDLYR